MTVSTDEPPYDTSGSVTPSGNVNGGSGGDLNTNTVATDNRTSTSGVSVTFTSGDALTMQVGDGFLQKSISHSLGKLPIVGGAVVSSSLPLIAAPFAPNASTISIAVMGGIAGGLTDAAGNQFGGSYVESELEAHFHQLSFNTVANGDTGTVYIW